MKFFNISAVALTATALSLSAGAVLAAGSHAGGHSHDSGPSIGQAGRSNHVDRVIHVEMGEMFFSPSAIEVREGETIRFVVTNTGDFVHEFNLGTEAMHMAHADEMMVMMEEGILESDRINHHMMNDSGMAHNDENSILLEPGKTAEMIWKFDGNAELALELSCNVPGHREGGMIGPVRMTGSTS